MTKKVLVIAYVFPPIAYAGTHRTLRLCKYLSRLGYELHVLTIKVQKDLHNDFDLYDKIKNDVTIHRTETIDIWRIYNKYKDRFLKAKTGRHINRLLSFLIEVMSQPDHMNLWVPFAVQIGRKIIKKHHIDVIYSTSPPHSQLMTGFFLKRMTNVPWVADLRDPIIFNIGSVNWKGIERAVYRSLEKLTIKNADAIITNTKAARDELTLKCKHKKVFCIQNSFDEDDFKELDKGKFPKFTISHLGTVYGFRNSEALFESLATLHRIGNISPDDFEVRFYGINDNVLSATIEKYRMWELVKIEPLVTHRASLEIMNRSHMLLLLKGFNANGLGQVPGKLFEYIGTGNPILYIGPKKCEAAEIVRDVGKNYIVGDDGNKIKDAILAEYQKYQNYSESVCLTPKMNKRLEKYTSHEMVQRMSSLFAYVNSKT